MKIAIRLDDISKDMNWDNFFRAKEILDKHNIKPLIGVIPDNKDEMLFNFASQAPIPKEGEDADAFFAYIRELASKGWVVAMHGNRHIYSTGVYGLFPLNDFSEFAGLPYVDQYESLKRGVKILAGHKITTDIFMAPAHSFDKNTLKALKELGFKFVTDGFGVEPYKDYGMTFLPISLKRSSTIKACKQGREGFSTFVYHTNAMNDGDFDNLSMLLEKYDCISYSQLLYAPSHERAIIERFQEYFLAVAKHFLVNM